MVTQLSEEDKKRFLFSFLVMTYQTSALIHMGKVKDPETKNFHKDLEKAELSIDILEMIQDKTKNNLTKDESDLLNNVLDTLKRTLISESNSNGSDDQTIDKKSADNVN